LGAAWRRPVRRRLWCSAGLRMGEGLGGRVVARMRWRRSRGRLAVAPGCGQWVDWASEWGLSWGNAVDAGQAGEWVAGLAVVGVS
jgi:hypothetical protein